MRQKRLYGIDPKATVGDILPRIGTSYKSIGLEVHWNYEKDDATLSKAAKYLKDKGKVIVPLAYEAIQVEAQAVQTIDELIRLREDPEAFLRRESARCEGQIARFSGVGEMYFSEKWRSIFGEALEILQSRVDRELVRGVNTANHRASMIEQIRHSQPNIVVVYDKHVPAIKKACPEYT